MAELAGAGARWLARLWRRSREVGETRPGTRSVLPVAEALGALEARICDGLVHSAAEPASAALARRRESPGPVVRNAFGRPLREEVAAGPGQAVAVATGMTLAGLRATAFLAGDELASAHAGLRGCARRLVPLVVHADAGEGGHDAAGAGLFQVIASSGQEALDWTLLARWLAERSLLPGLVAADLGGVESLALPDEELLRSYLGAPGDPIECPSEAQRLLFGAERTRLLAWFDPDRPVATGGLRSAADLDRGRAARRLLFQASLPELARQGMAELSRLTGRPLSFVSHHGIEDAELVVVGQGAVVQAARAVADHLRGTRGWRVGVLGVSWLRPFPAAEVASTLRGRRDVAVVELRGEAPTGGEPLASELAEAAGGSDGWVSARCGSAGPDPRALVGLLERMRQTDCPRRIDLDPAPVSTPTGFPRRDAAIQRLAGAFPERRESVLPAAEALPPDPAGGSSAALLGREGELPPDALARFAEAVADAAGERVRGTRVRTEPGVWLACVRAAAADFADPGPRAPVSRLLVSARDLRDLGHPLEGVTPGGAVLIASDDAPERAWAALPAAWRSALRERELRLLLVPGDFGAGLAALRACLRGEPEALLERGELRELAWRELSEPASGDRELPRLVGRIARVRESHDSLPRFWGEVVQPRQGGACDTWPDPLLASGAVPAAASALAPASQAAVLPVLDPDACSGCGRCWSACPDSAIGATALGVEALFTAASRIAGTEGRAADALRRAHRHLAGRVAGELARGGPGHLDTDHCQEAWAWLAGRLDLSGDERPAYDAAFAATAATLDLLEPVVTGPLFREAEAKKKGAGELLVLAVDPRACLGCSLCVAECPEDALRPEPRVPERVAELRRRWQAWEQLPDTAGETLARAAEHPELGPMAAALLSRHCAQAQVGGGWGEPGSGERLAGRLVAALLEHHGQRRTAGLVKALDEQRASLEQKARERLAAALSEADLATLEEALGGVASGRADLTALGERLESLGSRATFDRSAVLRVTRLAREVEGTRQRLAEGRDGLGRARFGVVVAQGRVAEWAARFPGHPYYAPLALAPTPEGADLARGIACGLVAEHLSLVRTLERAALEADPPPDRSARLDAIAAVDWRDLEREQRASCPPLLLLGDESALLEHGVAALMRLLTSDLPVKVVLLDGRGRLAATPEPALVAMAHRRAFVLAGSLAHPEHLARGLADALAWPGPALVHLHAPSPLRHGFPPDATLERARLAVEARVHPLLRYDPAAPGLFGLRASLEGNPGLDRDWGDATFADWAAGESRFAGHFEPVEDEGGVSLAEWLALPESGRRGKRPVVERDGRRLAVGERVVEAAGECLTIWSTLRELTGVASPFTERIRAAVDAELRAGHRAEIGSLESDYQARLAEARTAAEQAALERLTERLLVLSGYPPGAAPRENGT